MAKYKNQKFDCAFAAEHIHEFLDGELQADLTAAMESHLNECADCAKVFQQLRQIEQAHQQLDAKLAPPPEDYWQTLPQRVIERVEMAERRQLHLKRIFTLPRRSHSPSTVGDALPDKIDQTGMLYLPPRVRALINGPGKYALALAAVVTFCFFMIRELREKPAAWIAPKQVIERETPPTKPQHDIATEDFRPLAAPQVAKAPVEQQSTPAKEEQPSSEIVSRNRLLANVEGKPEIAVAQQETVNQGASRITIIESKKSKLFAESPAPGVAHATDVNLGQPPSPTELQQTKTLSEAAVTAESQPSDKNVTPSAGLLQQGQITESAKEATALSSSSSGKGVAATTESTRQSVLRVSALPDDKKRRLATMAMQKAGASSEATRFSEILVKAQQTASLSEREKVWRDFLATEPDSAYRALAISHLAQTLAAATDSSSTRAELEQNFAFFRENSATLRSLMGAHEYERELTRLLSLLKWRQSSAGEKP
jgi:hypothetical protein